MAVKRTVATQNDRAFWREVYRAAVQSLIERHDGSASPDQVADDAEAHADRAVRKLQAKRMTWGAS